MTRYTSKNEDENMNPAGEILNRQSVKIRISVITTALLILAALNLILFKLYVAAVISAAFSLVSATYMFSIMHAALRKVGGVVDEVTGMTVNQGEFISGFSHRIREPLNNLVILGELLSATTLTEKQKEMVETLIASTTNMATTVNELTMQGAGSIVFEKRKSIRFNILSSIQSTVEMFRMGSTSDIAFHIESVEKDGAELVGDPIIIKQIILDILNNLEFKERNSRPVVNIFIEKPVDNGQEIILKLRIASALNLLRSQYRDEPLPLSIKLIDSGMGEYTYSEEDGNNVLSISLPFAPTGKDEAEKAQVSAKITELVRETARKKELKELNLLLVEDNPINQKITFLTLKPLVKSIDTASNGKEALDKIATADYDIILMDIQMPVMDGLVATDKIRALEKSTGKHVPIIAITANAMLGDKEKCLSAGMDDYISKPFQPAALIEKIRIFF